MSHPRLFLALVTSVLVALMLGLGGPLETSPVFMGVASASPDIFVSPFSFDYALIGNDPETRTVTVTNGGNTDLDYSVILKTLPPPVFFFSGPKVAVHVQDHLPYGKGASICTPATDRGPAPTVLPCSEYRTRAPLNRGQDIYIVVGNADTTGIGGVIFGIEYDNAWGSGVDIVGPFYMCASGLQFPSNDWPGSGSGNVITWNTLTACGGFDMPPNGYHAIAGAFYVYAYSEDAFSITRHNRLLRPTLKTANCFGVEKTLDPATAAGSIAFSDGSLTGFDPCPGDPTGTVPSWLSVNPAGGTIPPGESALLDLTADASGLAPGSKRSAVMRILSNDPITTQWNVPVTLEVEYPSVIATATDVEPNTLNAASSGNWIFATVELPETYDPADIVLETVRVLGTVAADTEYSEYVDFNGNGIPDRKMRFDRAALIGALPEADIVEITVTGVIRDQAIFTAEDEIIVVRPHLVTPNGGEQLLVGTWAEIKWQKPAGWEDMTSSLFYWSQASEDWILIQDGIVGTRFVWRVVNEPSTECRIRVEIDATWGLAGFDSSDGPFAITEAVTGIGDSPDAYVLLQNSPNPFRASTVIRFSLPREDRISIHVFDAAGRRVRSLVDRTLPSGWHDVSWDGRDDSGRSAASGIYFYLMRTSERRETKRMFLLR